ncbi:MAG: hypothetical protein ACKO4U_07270, partial [Caldilinea sp.]
SLIFIVCGADKAWGLHRSVGNRAALSKKQKRECGRPAICRPHSRTPSPPSPSARTPQPRRWWRSSYAIDAYLRKEPILTTCEAERTHARTPRFFWNLQTPPTWTTSVETLAVKTLPPG